MLFRSMAVAYEPLEDAVERIRARAASEDGAGQGAGEVMALRRPG